MKLAQLVLIGLTVLVGFGASAEAQQVTQIQARIVTADVTGAGTDAKVFLGVGGREFRLDSDNPSGDFERGQDVTYTLGVNANANFMRNPAGDTGTFNIENAADNDPRLPPGLDVRAAENPRLPIYIRMSDVSFDPANPLTFPDDDWFVTFVEIQVRTGDMGQNLAFTAVHPILGRRGPGSTEFLRLGSETGFYLYFILD
jgi:hypothetical protein